MVAKYLLNKNQNQKQTKKTSKPKTNQRKKTQKTQQTMQNVHMNSLFLRVPTTSRTSSGITYCDGINPKSIGAEFTEHHTGLDYL